METSILDVLTVVCQDSNGGFMTHSRQLWVSVPLVVNSSRPKIPFPPRSIRLWRVARGPRRHAWSRSLGIFIALVFHCFRPPDAFLAYNRASEISRQTSGGLRMTGIFS